MGREPGKITAEVTPSQGIKCPRCWNYHTVRENHDGLCDRCLRLIAEHWADDYPEAAANWQAQKVKYGHKPTNGIG